MPGGYPSLDDTGQIPASELANAGGGGTRTVIKRFGGTVMGPTVRNYDVGVVEKIATVTAIRIKVPDGTSATVNVRKNGTTNLISADQTVAAATTYTTVPGGLLQNTTLAANDYLEILLTAVTGAVTEVAVQVVTTEQD
jgi:hypothetical protein